MPMFSRKITCPILFLYMLMLILLSAYTGRAQNGKDLFKPQIPRAWDDEALATMEVPLVQPGHALKHASSDYYYQMIERRIYKSYPVYAPGKEPPGYIEWLKQQEPEIAFDPSKLKTEEDWIKAGEIVFDAPIA